MTTHQYAVCDVHHAMSYHTTAAVYVSMQVEEMAQQPDQHGYTTWLAEHSTHAATTPH